MSNNLPTDHDIFVEILKFKGVVKMKILIITSMIFDPPNEFSIPKNIHLDKYLD